jgi:hypothetical protein
MLSLSSVADLSDKQVYIYRDMVMNWFKFVNTDNLYDHKQLLEVFTKEEVHGCLIDPFTGLNHNRAKNGFDRNYEFLNEARQFVNSTGKTLYVNSHCVSEATRRVHPKDHPDFASHPMPPGKADTEGGQAFANRCDDFFTFHRYAAHPVYRTITHWHVRKVKDEETGGRQTELEYPISLQFNYGKGFIINGHDPLRHEGDVF